MLHDQLAMRGAELVVGMLRELESKGELVGEQQQEALVTYAAKLAKSEAPLDWNHPAVELACQVRAFNPFPVAQASFGGELWRIWFAHAAPYAGGSPGEIVGVENSIMVACGTGTLCIEELQRPGGRRLSAREFLAGMPLKAGQHFEA
jgi:methionyl-tRNA formyltransferase